MKRAIYLAHALFLEEKMKPQLVNELQTKASMIKAKLNSVLVLSIRAQHVAFAETLFF